jgi:serine/threonine protein kinase
MTKKLAGDYFMDPKKFDFFRDHYHLSPTLTISEKFAIQTDTTEKYLLCEGEIPLFFLKQIPLYASREGDVVERAQLLRLLKSQNFPVPTLIGPKFTRYQGRLWQLFEYIPGVRCPKTKQSFLSGCQCILQLHSILPPPSLPFTKTNATLSLLILLLEQEGFAHKEFLDSIQKYSTSVQDFDLPLTWIHGDLSHNNCLYQEDTLIALLDFDNATTFHRLRDFCEYFLTFFSFHYVEGKTNFLDRIPDYISFDFSIFPLTKEEKKAAPNMMKLVFVELLALGFLRGDFSCTPKNFEIALRILKRP